jgi:hypothetical protein
VTTTIAIDKDTFAVCSIDQVGAEIEGGTKQEKFWSGRKGTNYSWFFRRNPEQLDAHWMEQWGVKRSDVVKRFMAGIPKDSFILETGCNVGNQLELLNSLGYRDLMGIEINPWAAGYATCRGFNVFVANIRKIDLPVNMSDMVYHCAVVSHLTRELVDDALREIGRLSKKWVFGTEYCGTKDNHADFCWCDDYKARFLAVNPDFEMVRSELLCPDGQGLEAYLTKRKGT